MANCRDPTGRSGFFTECAAYHRPPLRELSPVACFSPSVPLAIREAWVAHGGSIVQSAKDIVKARYFFCGGTRDPWLPRLMEKSIAVFHANWIVNAVAENFPITIVKYVLDSPCTASPLSHPSNASLHSDCCEVNPPPLHSQNAQELIRPSPPKPALPSKRPFIQDDVPQTDQRPRKKARFAKLEVGSKSKRIQKANSARENDEDHPFCHDSDGDEDCVPHIDLCKLSKLARTSVAKGSKNAALKIRQVRNVAATKGKPPMREDVWRSLLGPDCFDSQVSISAALDALRDVSTAKSAPFRPGSSHLGKTFQCCYVESLSSAV
ncbi:uncharacterized protein LAESUDRAFT_758601 [Laetiporus sulphureus 93-53]|uniref:BRCT domain-containing protein n=1 Tax=Laetiporus sulphureus 93-53 TaxID=1314785 RepID=A0A165EJG2_9APHY|nr:uncharacterized protein LAESUDRAFT_758601 [Laetiporus sulphureus 93-53]KZT07178.1 hypothetical protein LAESUDRAFT_758601 [Laetiporus sulphureus 93-53]